MKRIGIPAVALAAAFGAAPALAHTGHGVGLGLASGFAHPIAGLDHVLAMVAVGLLAATLGGRALWLVPGAFLAAMAGAGLVGLAGWPLPLVELGIVGSVVVLGALLALNARPSALAAALIVGAFAVFHGHAHGAEAPAAAAPALYALGFVLATALLHAAGIGLGLLLARAGRLRLPVVRIGGAAIAAAGVMLLL